MGTRITIERKNGININEIVDKIVANISPEMVVLFGSFANNTANEDSDVDILVVTRFQTQRSIITRQIDQLFSDRLFPIDIVVYSPDEVKEFKAISGSFIKDVFDHGKILYEKAA